MKAVGEYYKLKEKVKSDPPSDSPIIINGLTIKNMPIEQVKELLQQKIAKKE